MDKPIYSWTPQHPKDVPGIFDLETTGKCLGGSDRSGFDIIEATDDARVLYIDGIEYADIINYMARQTPGLLKPKHYAFISQRVFDNGHEIVVHIYDRDPYATNVEAGFIGLMSNEMTFVTGTAFFIPFNFIHPTKVKTIRVNATDWIQPFQTYVGDENEEFHAQWLYGVRLDQGKETEETMFVDLSQQPNGLVCFGDTLAASTLFGTGMAGRKLDSNDRWFYYNFVDQYSDNPLLITTIQPGVPDTDLEDLNIDLIFAVEHSFKRGLLKEDDDVLKAASGIAIYINGTPYPCHITRCQLPVNDTQDDPVSNEITQLIKNHLIDVSLDMMNHPIYMISLLDEVGRHPGHFGFDYTKGHGQFTALGYPATT